MTYSVQEIAEKISSDRPRMGDIKKLAREIKQDHGLGMDLWQTGDYALRMLAVLIFDKSLITQSFIEQIATDLENHTADQRDRLSEWFMANQLMKAKETTALLSDWQDHAHPTLRRLFWYHQARLRWTGQTPPPNTANLVEALQSDLAKEVPEVQWAMNFAAGQIGIFEEQYRESLVSLGEKTGLYRDQKVPKNCTPNYLPEFIRIESAKRAAKS